MTVAKLVIDGAGYGQFVERLAARWDICQVPVPGRHIGSGT
jgi:hypothetical protein